MWFTILLSWLVAFNLVLGSWTAVCVLYFWYAEAWALVGSWVMYMFGSLCIMVFLRYGVLDNMLVYKGDITKPHAFTLVWIILLVSNFVIGVTLAMTRLAVLFMYGIASACFLHYSLLPEELLFCDTGYYGFLAMAYTWYERQNPVKKAFNTCAMFRIHRVFGPPSFESSDGGYSEVGGRNPQIESAMDSAAVESERRRIRAKNRFNLALTLWRNPSLIHERSHRDPRSAEATDDMVSCSEEPIDSSMTSDVASSTAEDAASVDVQNFSSAGTSADSLHGSRNCCR
jgi:hypothetical protein